jgi:hypothetical protein
MITATSYQEVEMGEKDLSPQQSILTHSYDEEEFDLPQVLEAIVYMDIQCGSLYSCFVVKCAPYIKCRGVGSFIP